MAEEHNVRKVHWHCIDNVRGRSTFPFGKGMAASNPHTCQMQQPALRDYLQRAIKLTLRANKKKREREWVVYLKVIHTHKPLNEDGK